MATADFGVQEYATTELLTYVKQHPNLKLLAYSPLLQGLYNKKMALPEKYNTPENHYRLNKLAHIAGELDATPNQVVLSWLIQAPPSVIPIVAASSLAQLRENLQASYLKLTEEQLVYLS
ncbi:aldo/keto reductase [Vagococcus sp. BWB3-3]|uniref:Aldo/keto reductase n=1 Tax=Vagococcus allomyrinae TaxID=2794353 RepID=A0A940SUP5_9ENTE|nr:aldo/keto reductase [Vagococcus allomyrinae]MBP1040256.1 aldo/keto reductase [Vagococcus allomyrinae]